MSERNFRHFRSLLFSILEQHVDQLANIRGAYVDDLDAIPPWRNGLNLSFKETEGTCQGRWVLLLDNGTLCTIKLLFYFRCQIQAGLMSIIKFLMSYFNRSLGSVSLNVPTPCNILCGFSVRIFISISDENGSGAGFLCNFGFTKILLTKTSLCGRDEVVFEGLSSVFDNFFLWVCSGLPTIRRIHIHR